MKRGGSLGVITCIGKGARTWVIPKGNCKNDVETHENHPFEPIGLSVLHDVVYNQDCLFCSKGPDRTKKAYQISHRFDWEGEHEPDKNNTIDS